MSKIKLSILLPTFNRVHLLKQCIHQLLTKKYHGVSEIEILVGDNCSEDETEKYLSRCDGIKVIRQNTNLGYAGNALSLLAASAGEYIWIIGDDDLVLLESCEILRILEDQADFYIFDEKWILNQCRTLEYPDNLMDIPLGFVSNVIIKASSLNMQYMSENLGYGNHDSPHFFSRWLLILKDLKNVVHINQKIVNSIPVSLTRWQFIVNVLYPFKYDRSMNWYYAFYFIGEKYPTVSKIINSKLLETCFVNNMRAAIEISPIKFHIYWFFKAWHGIIIKPGYMIFMLRCIYLANLRSYLKNKDDSCF